MKEYKIEKNYIYHGFGFPIVLHNVPMIEVRGEWVPDLKWRRLERIVLLMLVHQSSAFTGNQVRFIRHCMEMSLRDFADLLGVTHPAVVKWEKFYDKPAKMTLTTQISIRLRILDDLIVDNREFRNAYRAITALTFHDSITPLEINTQTDLIAV